MGARYQQPQIGVGLDQANPLTQGAYAWLPSSPLVLFGKRTVVAATENAYNSSPVGDVGVGRKWSRSANAGVDFGLNQIITQNSGVSVLVVAAPTAAASMKVPFSQRIGSGNYTQTDFVFNAATIDSLGASAGNLALTTYHAGSGGLLAAGQVDGKTHYWVAGNGPSTGYLIRDGVEQTLSTSTRMSTFTGATQKLRIGNMADDATTTYPCDDPVYLVVVWDRLLSKADAKAVSANPWQLFRQPIRITFLKAPAATGAALAVAANTAPAFGSMAFKSQPVFAVSAITAAVQGAMSFGPASRVAVNATTGDTVGSMVFKSQPVFGVAATTGQTLGSMAFKAQPSLGVNAQTAPVVGSMAFGPSARLSVSATLAPTVGNMAFVAQPKFAVAAQTAPAVGSMAFGPSSRLTVTGETAPTVGAMAFKSQPVLAVAAQTAPAVGSMAFAVSPQFGVLATLSPVVGSMAFLSGYVADIPGELCLEPRRLGTISSTIRKLGTIHFEARPL